MYRKLGAVGLAILLTGHVYPSGQAPPRTVDACSEGDDPCQAQVALDAVVATAGDLVVTERDLMPIQARLSDLENQIYHLKKKRVDDVSLAALLHDAAQYSGMAPKTLYDRNVSDRVHVEDEEIAAFLDEQRISALSLVRRWRLWSQAKRTLEARKTRAFRRSFFEQLKRRADVEISYKFDVPKQPSLPIQITSKDPFIGNSVNPKVRIVAFADYLCVHCRELSATLKELVRTYPEALVVYFKPYPRGRNPVAVDASLVGELAFRQGKYPFAQDALYENQSVLTRDRILKTADALGLQDVERTLLNRSSRQAILDEYESAMNLGILKTPTVVIGSQVLIGTKDLETYVSVIDAVVHGGNR